MQGRIRQAEGKLSVCFFMHRGMAMMKYMPRRDELWQGIEGDAGGFFEKAEFLMQETVEKKLKSV